MRSPVACRARSPLAVAVQAALRRGVPTARRVTNWARLATGARGRGAEIVVRIVGLAEGRRLNAAWRGKDYATNVLSFPPVVSGARHATGDLTTRPRALHLRGFGHEREPDALRMERRERRLLAACGWPDPYAVRESSRSRA